MSFAVNDLKGNIPKFVVNAGASTYATTLNNLKRSLEEMDKNGTLPNIKSKHLFLYLNFFV